MKTVIKHLILGLMALGVIFGNKVCLSQIISGQTAPVFSTQDLKGQTRELSQMKGHPMIILYFFDVDSRPSQEGLLSLNQLAKQYKEADLVVWAITISQKEKVDRFMISTGISFPILLDQSNISNLYQARLILPTVCIIGPNLKIFDYYQGGGKTTEKMLERVAERELQQRKPKMAKAISEEILKKNPQNVKAKTVIGYSALREKNFKGAEESFKNLSKEGAQGEVLGKEGLADVYAQTEQPEKALQLVKEVEEKAPERAYVHVIKGDLLYAQDKKKEAEVAFQTALQKTESEPYQEAVKYNQLGRLYSSTGDYAKAQGFYDKAVTIDPYYIEGTTNKGIAYEKEGKWDKALESYRQALAIDKNDLFAVTLAKKAMEMLDIQKNVERKKRMDQLVRDLISRYQTQKETRPPTEDMWTSPPMVLSFVDFQEKGGLAERDGFSTVLMAQLGEHLNASGRVKVVDRILIERIIEELNIGSSDLANPETALKLGRILAARLIGTGSLYYLPQGTLLSLRLIDTETSGISQVWTKQITPQGSLEQEFYQLNREILKQVMSDYPLRGYLVKVMDDQVMINLGSKQGVVLGSEFEVLEEQESIKYKGKALQSSPKSIAQIEITKVEPDLSFAKILKQEKPLKVDHKIQEKIVGAAMR